MQYPPNECLCWDPHHCLKKGLLEHQRIIARRELRCSGAVQARSVIVLSALTQEQAFTTCCARDDAHLQDGAQPNFLQVRASNALFTTNRNCAVVVPETTVAHRLSHTLKLSCEIFPLAPQHHKLHAPETFRIVAQNPFCVDTQRSAGDSEGIVRKSACAKRI